MLLCSNYDFANHNKLSKIVNPYKIYKFNKIKIGVYGLGIDPKGLIDPYIWDNTKYKDPMQTAAEMTYLLKKDYKCNLIICLSHLGYKG